MAYSPIQIKLIWLTGSMINQALVSFTASTLGAIHYLIRAIMLVLRRNHEEGHILACSKI